MGDPTAIPPRDAAKALLRGYKVAHEAVEKMGDVTDLGHLRRATAEREAAALVAVAQVQATLYVGDQLAALVAELGAKP